MTIKDIEAIEDSYRQTIAVAEAGLKKCAKWREGLTTGTRKAPQRNSKISAEDQKKIDKMMAKRRADFDRKYKSNVA